MSTNKKLSKLIEALHGLCMKGNGMFHYPDEEIGDNELFVDKPFPSESPPAADLQEDLNNEYEKTIGGIFHVIARLHHEASKKTFLGRLLSPNSTSAEAGRTRDTLLHHVKRVTGQELRLGRLMRAVNSSKKQGRDYGELAKLYYQFAQSCSSRKSITNNRYTARFYRNPKKKKSVFRRIYEAIYKRFFPLKLEAINQEDNPPSNDEFKSAVYTIAGRYVAKSGASVNLANLAASALVYKQADNPSKSVDAAMAYWSHYLSTKNLKSKMEVILPDGTEQTFDPIAHLSKMVSELKNEPDVLNHVCRKVYDYNNRGKRIFPEIEHVHFDKTGLSAENRSQLFDLLNAVNAAIQQGKESKPVPTRTMQIPNGVDTKGGVSPNFDISLDDDSSMEGGVTLALSSQ